MAEQNAETAPARPRRKLPVTLLVVVGVAVVEAAGFFLIFKVGGSGPKPAHGEESHVAEPPAAPVEVGVAEVPVLRAFRVPNDKTGLLYIYDMDVSVVVAAPDREKMETLAKDRAGEIGDQIARIMRAASERILREDDLRVLRAQFQEALGEIAGEPELVQRVLIPRFVPLRSD